MFVPISNDVAHFNLDDDMDVFYDAPGSANAVSIIAQSDNLGDLLISFEEPPDGSLFDETKCLKLYPGISWTSGLPYKVIRRVFVRAATGYSGGVRGQLVFGVSD
jgi:hypothetical protein